MFILVVKLWDIFVIYHHSLEIAFQYSTHIILYFVLKPIKEDTRKTSCSCFVITTIKFLIFLLFRYKANF